MALTALAVVGTAQAQRGAEEAARWARVSGGFVVGMALLVLLTLALLVALGRRRGGWAGRQTESPASSAQARVHQRVRLGIYVVVLVAGGLSVFQTWHAAESNELHAIDAEALNLAGAQRMLSQRIGRLAGLGLERSRDDRLALTETLERANLDAQRLERLLERGYDPASGHAPAVAAAMAQWKAAREPLWFAGNALLDGLEGDDPARRRDLQADVAALADPALAAADNLVETLVQAARQRDLAGVTAAKVWLGLNLVLLSALAIGVAETTARFVRRQYLKLAAQARELERLALVAERTTNAVMLVDAQACISWVNRAFSQVTGHGAQAALGQNPQNLLDNPRADPRVMDRLRAALAQGQEFRAQCLMRHGQGGDLWLDLDVQALREPSGAPGGFVIVAADVTERRNAQAQALVAAIAFDSSQAIVVADAAQAILKVNPAFTRITGYSAAEALGQTTGRLLRSGRHDAAFYQAMWRVLRAQNHWEGEIWNRRKNGEVFPEWLSITAVVDDEGTVTHYVAVFNDITERKQDEERIHQLAFYDPLTALPNRRLLLDRLQQAMASSARHQRPAAVVFIDLDRFKQLNDTLGHDHGDLLLVEVARRLVASVRANDTVARHGGDEFVIVLDELSADAQDAQAQAALIAEKIRDAIDQPFELRGHEHRSTPSVGVCLFMGKDLGVDELLRRADMAMYAAKQAGRNTVRFFEAPAAAAAPAVPVTS